MDTVECVALTCDEIVEGDISPGHWSVGYDLGGLVEVGKVPVKVSFGSVTDPDVKAWNTMMMTTTTMMIIIITMIIIVITIIIVVVVVVVVIIVLILLTTTIIIITIIIIIINKNKHKNN